MQCLNALRCVGCGSGGLRMLDDFLVCPSCGRSYPVLADVPVMISDAFATRGPFMEPAVVEAVLKDAGLPSDPITALRVRRASGARVQFGESSGKVECMWLLDRMRSAGVAIPAAEASPQTDPAAEDEDETPGCRWVTDTIPRILPPGAAFTAHVRFENIGATTMRHEGVGGICIASEWRNARGELVPSDDIRTWLPHDVGPGQALTAPVRLQPPNVAGSYSLSLKMVQEGVRWLQPDYGPLRIRLQHGATAVRLPHWRIDEDGPADSRADQDQAIALLRGWAAARGPAARMLELGDGTKPIVGHLPGEAYKVGMDLFGLQLGSVASRVLSQPVRHICAEVNNLPFPEAFFDGVVVFASLYHQADPVAALRALRAHLRPGGFIGLLCEPLSRTRSDAIAPSGQALEAKPIPREQSFSLDEYLGIFRAARLGAAEVVVDYNSLKARLVPSA